MANPHARTVPSCHSNTEDFVRQGISPGHEDKPSDDILQATLRHTVRSTLMNWLGDDFDAKPRTVTRP